MSIQVKPKILQIITTSEFGGAQDVVLNICKALSNQYDITVITTPGGILIEQLRACGIRVYTIPIENNNNPRVIWDLRSIVKSIDPDLIHAHDARAAFTASIAGYLAGSYPLLYHVHLFNPWRTRVGYTRFLDKLPCKLSSRIIACSDHLREYLAKSQGIDPATLVSIPNCVDTKKFAPRKAARITLGENIPEDAFVLLCCARLTENKGIVYLLRAMAGIKTVHPNVHLVLAGDGELKHDLITTARALGVASNVHFLGFVADVRPVLAQCDAYIQPSLVEGLPISVLEAMSMGKPVVATAISGTPEIVRHERTGLCVPAADPEALRDAIVRVIENPNARKAMASRGQRLVLRDYSLGSLQTRLDDLYSQLLPGVAT